MKKMVKILWIFLLKFEEKNGENFVVKFLMKIFFFFFCENVKKVILKRWEKTVRANFGKCVEGKNLAKGMDFW